MIRRPFEPAPEDSPVLDSILDYPVEPGRADDDHDDGGPPPAVPLIRRLAHRAREAMRHGE